MNTELRSNGYLSNVLLSSDTKLLLRGSLHFLSTNLLPTRIASIVDDVVAGEVGTKKVLVGSPRCMISEVVHRRLTSLDCR
jgi:hypothetical protein